MVAVGCGEAVGRSKSSYRPRFGLLAYSLLRNTPPAQPARQADFASLNLPMKSKRKRGTAPQELSNGPRGLDPRLRHVLAAAALCVVTLLAFSNSFQAGFVFDNQALLQQDPRVQEATSQNVALIIQHSYWWPLGEAGLYRPLTTLSYLFNYAVLGDRDQPAGYHWINLILHLANVLLVYALALRLIRKFWPSVFVAAVWAVHPVLTESVTNIVGRADLLAALAILSGFLMYLKSTETSGGWRVAWLTGLMAATAVGVFSKESAVAILGVMGLHVVVWWKERHQWRGFLLGCFAVLPPVALMLYQRSNVLAHSIPAQFPFTDNPIIGADFWIGRLTAIKVIAHYLFLTIWPVKLSNDYSFRAIPLAHGSLGDWVAWIAVAVVIAGVALLYRRNRTAFFLACFAAVNLVPVSNLLFPIGTILAERLLYLPSIALLACIVLGIYAIAERFDSKTSAPILLCLIVAILSVRTWVRNADWHDDISLYSSAVQAAPDSFKSHRLLAAALFDADSSHSNIDRAIEEIEKSMMLVDPLPDVLNKSGSYQLAALYYMTKGDVALQKESSTNAPRQESTEAYQKALRVLLRCVSIDESPTPAYDRRLPEQVSTTYQLLSGAYLRLGNAEKGLAAATRARDLQPLNPGKHQQVYFALLASRRGEDAAVALWEGVFLTADRRLQEQLMNLYQKGSDPKGCAVRTGPDGSTIDPSCEIVHKHICAASVDTIKVRLKSSDRDLATTQKRTFVRDYGCPAGPLDQILPDQVSGKSATSQ